MKLLDVAKEFAQINLFNPYSQSTAIRTAKIFSERSETLKADQISLSSIALFKERTLSVAQPITYNGYLRYLRVIGDYAVEQGYAQKNFFRDVKLASLGHRPPKTISHKSMAVVDAHICAHTHLYEPFWFWLAAIHCLYYTGMRRRQLVNLKLSDIDFESRTVLLSRQGSKTTREWRIPLHDELAIYLQEFIVRTEKNIGRRLEDGDYLFQICRLNYRYMPDGNTGRMKPESITGFFKRLSKNTGLKIGAHRFRHTLATTLCNPEDDSVPDIFAVQAILGHTSLQTTRGYVTTSIQRMASTLGKMA